MVAFAEHAVHRMGSDPGIGLDPGVDLVPQALRVVTVEDAAAELALQAEDVAVLQPRRVGGGGAYGGELVGLDLGPLEILEPQVQWMECEGTAGRVGRCIVVGVVHREDLEKVEAGVARPFGRQR